MASSLDDLHRAIKRGDIAEMEAYLAHSGQMSATDRYQ
jgi:hypothetical protein